MKGRCTHAADALGSDRNGTRFELSANLLVIACRRIMIASEENAETESRTSVRASESGRPAESPHDV
jgi:hypothetical protein